MSWRKVKVGDFLKERKERYRPEQANRLNMKRLEKIDFSGNIYYCEPKNTGTNMILVKSGDLVVSGINVAKGAVAVYQGKEDLLATIHYSSYEFDRNIIDIEYFKWFLKSEQFRQIIQNQVKGGIKTELKPKKLLSLEVDLPDLTTQKEIRDKINNVNKEIEEVKQKQYDNGSLVENLRQSILSEAVQGKLVPQDPNDEPASELLKKIKAEKEKLIKEKKIRKEKPLPEITEEEKPFELPEGWEWVRLGKIIKFSEDLNIQTKLSPDDIIHYVDVDAVDNKNHKISECKIRKVSELSTRARRVLKEGYILYSLVRPYLNNIAFVNESKQNYIGSTGFVIFKPIYVDNRFLYYYLLCPFIRTYYLNLLKGFNSPSIKHSNFINTPFPLPPFSEQKRIVQKVEELMKYCDELEEKTKQNQEYSEQLMEAVLREAFVV